MEARKLESLFSQDLREWINQIVADCLSSSGASVMATNRQLNVGFLSKIDESGLLEFRGSPDYVANVRGISRARFYVFDPLTTLL